MLQTASHGKLFSFENNQYEDTIFLGYSGNWNWVILSCCQGPGGGDYLLCGEPLLHVPDCGEAHLHTCVHGEPFLPPTCAGHHGHGRGKEMTPRNHELNKFFQ